MRLKFCVYGPISEFRNISWFHETYKNKLRENGKSKTANMETMFDSTLFISFGNKSFNFLLQG